MTNKPTAGERSDLEYRYKNDKQIDQLVKQMANVYADEGIPVEATPGAVTSELSPEGKAGWEALNQELHEYIQAHYAFLKEDE